ncbi:mitochondrial transcription factor B-like protein [Conidiobolus coronatus NRRL 28638]|uniref:rRNA adenine N(6)-methyltransferase n=1 Tax=Conidiobolus coronatus (strain ATCC 28846 / CBS 209.66 / NRRL 28638) TaxID=796925 RepID=A0A137P993_CONC2|nr:mitochondrial transcription factor B-like protein [Conidiobolus coronatus NRRL 28638]|eukprot:KXN71570.1 mitochondrial transcription factor B-like protein [Conidiobolus coronatus NRRL 28638]
MNQLPRLPSVKDIIQIYKLSANQSLSQNFILDKNVTDKLVKKAKLNLEKSLVIEVGPGPGLLTRSLLESGVENLVVIEKDERFLPTLNQLKDAVPSRLKIIHGDMLQVNYNNILETVGLSHNSVDRVHLVGNLPFNVATPLLLQWLNMVYNKNDYFQYLDSTMTLMFQKEVAERIASPADIKQRSRLSIMSQAICSANVIYKVPSSSFVPKPKVDGWVAQLTPNSNRYQLESYERLERVLRVFFLKRRKTIRRIATDYDPQLYQLIKELNWDETKRPENISVEQFCKLTNVIHSNYPDLV